VTTFDSTKSSLSALLSSIREGRIQLPDFQRGWVWDDDHVRSLLVSIARSFPVGAVMLLETGGEVRFQVRPVEGVRADEVTDDPERLILDGQQRLTSLVQAIALDAPVATRTSKDKPIKRHYYFHIPTALEADDRLEDAIVGVDESRQVRTNFGRNVELDLSTRDSECEQLYFPCDQILDWSDWLQDLNRLNADALPQLLEFQRRVLAAFSDYHLPIIELKKETTKEAVCLVFEKVNTGGVKLSMFELVTASYAAEGYNLRDDWYGSDIRQVDSRKERLEQDPLLGDVESTEFLQAITLLHTCERKLEDLNAGKQGKQVRPVSAKRSSVLELPLEQYQRWADAVEQGFRNAARFLRRECFYDKRELPYGPQIVPLAAVMAILEDRWREHHTYNKLARWFWCGALGELYSGAVETRIANDFDELLKWIEDDGAVPRTISDAAFQPDRLDTLKSRLSAAYKAVNVLILRQGAQDFFWKAGIQELDAEEVALDIHHIFPQAWCSENGIPPSRYDSILNKTPISYKANRKIGGAAPSEYVRKIQDSPQVQLNDDAMDAILKGHCISPDHLRADDFDGFVEERRRRLLGLIEQVMGKRVLSDENVT